MNAYTVTFHGIRGVGSWGKMDWENRDHLVVANSLEAALTKARRADRRRDYYKGTRREIFSAIRTATQVVR